MIDSANDLGQRISNPYHLQDYWLDIEKFIGIGLDLLFRNWDRSLVSLRFPLWHTFVGLTNTTVISKLFTIDDSIDNYS